MPQTVRGVGRACWPTLQFAGLFAFLNAVLNLRYPRGENKFWYFTPAVDASIVLAVYAVFALRRKSVPRALHCAVVAFFILVRLVRFGDGFKFRHFQRPLNLYMDLGLLPSLVRLGYQTMPLYALVGMVLGVLLVVGLLAYLVHRALRAAESRLSRREVSISLALIVAATAALSFLRPRSHEDRYTGAFGASAVPRLGQELAFLFDLFDYRAEKLRAFTRMQEDFARAPSDLSKLQAHNVLVFFIESYGQVVIDRPDFLERARPLYGRIEGELAERGFAMASHFLTSSTYGGASWLAHATFATGIRIGDELDLELLHRQNPSTLAGHFQRAGYETILVQPGTTRRSSSSLTASFDRHYYAWELDYRGPQFGWAQMPDQYTLDFIRRRLLPDRMARRTRPLFLECMLVSSHTPWNIQAPIIADWNSIGDGSIFRELPTITQGGGWADLEGAADAYLDSILYDLEVLGRFTADFIRDDTLVILLGDHQPTAAITKESLDWNVPIHVISRHKASIDAFLAAGYHPGLLITEKRSLPMETFAPSFLRAFSSELGFTR